MTDVVLLALATGPDACPRVPVLTCADALRDAGIRVDLATAAGDPDVDQTLKPVLAGQARLVVAADSGDGCGFAPSRVMSRK